MFVCYLHILKVFGKNLEVCGPACGMWVMSI